MKLFPRFLPAAVSLVLAVLACVLKFCLPGYGFSALVCCCLMGIILFYEGCHMLRWTFPRGVRIARRLFTIVLVLGLLVVAVTEAVIIKASFGTPNDKAQYLVVLGAKVRTTGPSASLWDRIHAAAEYLHSHQDVIAIVSGGQGSDEPRTEASVMYEELIKLGIEPERIWMEDQATSTWENLNFSLALIEEKTGARPEKLGVLSSEYHLFRASLFTRKCGVDFVGVPARTTQPAQKINHFMREAAGVWHYLLLGGLYD